MLAASVDATTGNRVEMRRFIWQDFFLVSNDSSVDWSAVGTIPTTGTVLAIQRNTRLAFASIPITFVPAFSTQGFSRIYSHFRSLRRGLAIFIAVVFSRKRKGLRVRCHQVIHLAKSCRTMTSKSYLLLPF